VHVDALDPESLRTENLDCRHESVIRPSFRTHDPDHPRGTDDIDELRPSAR